jgi:hypothetical protein
VQVRSPLLAMDPAEHALTQSLEATARMFASCDTKWPEIMIGLAQNQLIDDAIGLALHLRRYSEISGEKIRAELVPLSLGIAGRNFNGHERDLWTSINRIVHHHAMKPHVLVDEAMFRADGAPMAGYLISDLEVTSDRGKSLINVAGLAVAAMNEIGGRILGKSQSIVRSREH